MKTPLKIVVYEMPLKFAEIQVMLRALELSMDESFDVMPATSYYAAYRLLHEADAAIICGNQDDGQFLVQVAKKQNVPTFVTRVSFSGESFADIVRAIRARQLYGEFGNQGFDKKHCLTRVVAMPQLALSPA